MCSSQFKEVELLDIMGIGRCDLVAGPQSLRIFMGLTR